MKKDGRFNFVVTVAITVVLFGGTYFAFTKGLNSYGYTLFCLTPIFVGFFVGQRPTLKSNTATAAVFGVMTFLVLAVLGGVESFVCVLLLSPLIFVGTILGTYIGYAIRKAIFGSDDDKTSLKLTVAPLAVLAIAAVIEHYFVDKNDYAKVSSAIYLPYSPATVYDYIKSVDTLDAEKPFLMATGLPVPAKCVLQKEAVGGMRTCYFDDGAIEEKITALKPGALLKMDVTKCTVPLPQWLKFEEAIYTFKAQGNGTLLTRTTTYRTQLKPRFYWGWLEAKCIEAEHEYVFNDLQRRLKGRLSQPK